MVYQAKEKSVSKETEETVKPATAASTKPKKEKKSKDKEPKDKEPTETFKGGNATRTETNKPSGLKVQTAKGESSIKAAKAKG